jgi:uncharacterized protein
LVVLWLALGVVAPAFLAAEANARQVDALLESLEPQGYVSDFAGAMGGLGPEIEALLTELQQKTGAEVAVVTVTSLDGGEATDFANRLFERWGVGGAERDDGVLLLAAIEDRQVRIEVGYGLEGVIPDGLAGQILDDRVLPFFREERYGEGLGSGAATIAAVIADDAGIELTGSGAVRAPPASSRGPGTLGTILRFGFILLAILLFIRNPWLALLLLASGRGGHFGGGGFGRGGGGGFGGFGGGMSGGGGAGRSW